MELQDINTMIMVGQASMRAAVAESAARKAQGRANDSFIAASIHSAAARAHADGYAKVFDKLLASDAEVERLEDKVDSQQNTIAGLVAQRNILIRECQILMEENAALLALKH